MVELLVNNILHLAMVLLGENFMMLDRLDRGVVIVLVNLTVDSLCELFMTSRLDVLADNAWGNALGHIGGVASLTGELATTALVLSVLM